MPDLNNTVRRCDEFNNERMAKIGERRGQREVRHERNVSGLIATISEVNAGRGFRSPAHADKHDVGMLKVLRQLAVVAHHAEIKRIDPLEVVSVEHVLCASTRS